MLVSVDKCSFCVRAARTSAYPYLVRRSRNHALPVYYTKWSRWREQAEGWRHIVRISHVDGDLQAFERDLRAWLEARCRPPEDRLGMLQSESNTAGTVLCAIVVLVIECTVNCIHTRTVFLTYIRVYCFYVLNNLFIVLVDYKFSMIVRICICTRIGGATVGVKDEAVLPRAVSRDGRKAWLEGPLLMQVNEVTRSVRVEGQLVEEVVAFLLNRGF